MDMEAIAAKPPGDNDEGISFADGFENNHCDFEHDSLMPDLETHDALDPSYIDKTKGGSTLSSPLAYAGQFELGAVNVLFNQPSPVSSPAGRCIFTFVLLACIQRQDLQAGAVGNARSSLERTPSSAESPSSLGYLHSQTAGMAAKSHGSISANQWQWHPHTVKVLSLLRQQFHGGTCGDDAGSVSTGTTSYNYITGASGGKKVIWWLGGVEHNDAFRIAFWQTKSRVQLNAKPHSISLLGWPSNGRWCILRDAATEGMSYLQITGTYSMQAGMPSARLTIRPSTQLTNRTND